MTLDLDDLNDGDTGTRRERVLDGAEAAAWVTDGMTIAIGEPAPMATVRQIISNGVRDLRVVGSGLGLDMLIAAGCVKTAVAYYVGGGPSFRAAAEAGAIEIWECEEGVLTAGLRAAAQGLPYLPWRGGLGTSLPEVNPDLEVIEDPFHGQPLLAVPAIDVDIAVLHASISDRYGNVQHHGGPGWLDLFLYRAAERCIVQVEDFVSNEAIRSRPWHTTIAAADAVVRAPWGAHPFYSRGHYVQDKRATRDYVTAATAAASGNRSPLNEWLDDYCYQPTDHIDYLERIGIRRLLSLHEY